MNLRPLLAGALLTLTAASTLALTITPARADWQQSCAGMTGRDLVICAWNVDHPTAALPTPPWAPWTPWPGTPRPMPVDPHGAPTLMPVGIDTAGVPVVESVGGVTLRPGQPQ